MIPIDHAKKLLEVRGFKIEDKEPVLATLLELLALHPKIYGAEIVSLKKMQSILREHGFRLDDNDPVLLMLALNDIAIKDHIKKIKPDRVAYVLTAKKLAALCIPVFVTGLLLGAKGEVGLWFASSLCIGLLVGLVSGLMFTSKLIAWDEVFRKSTVETVKPVEIKNVIDHVWTLENLTRAANELKLDSRSLAACTRVLIDKESYIVAAGKERVFKSSVERALHKLDSWIYESQ